jgi:DNA-binding SARP family transcriptional activator
MLIESVRLYRGHFMTGFSLRDAPQVNEWIFDRAEDLRERLARALTLLSEGLCSAGQPEEAIPYARRLVGLDPLNESSHRLLMEVYVEAGQHNAALKQYQACERTLRTELGVDPHPETRALYRRLRR